VATLTAQQRQVGTEIYSLGIASGLSPARADELAAAAFAESRWVAAARNKSSGAAGVFQLLSSGYVQRAEQLGGVDDVRANTLAILPDYLAFWKAHPSAAPGAAGAAVEASGQPASFYAAPLAIVRGVLSTVRNGIADLLHPASSSVHLQQVDPSLLGRLYALALELGKPLTLTSGYRSGTGGVGFAGDPHTHGIAVDAVVDGKPIGDVVPQSTFARLGLVSGNQAGFYPGHEGDYARSPSDPAGADPVHVQLAPASITPGFSPTSQLASASSWASRAAGWLEQHAGLLPGLPGIPGGGSFPGGAFDPFNWPAQVEGWITDTFVKPAAGRLAYAGVYALLVMFAAVLAIVGVLALLGVHPRTVVESATAGAKLAAEAA
jgi:hypothetical protein